MSVLADVRARLRRPGALLIAVAMGRGRTFLADWLPFLLLFFAYEAMRGFAAKTGFAPHDLAGLERAVFAGTLPTLTGNGSTRNLCVAT